MMRWDRDQLETLVAVVDEGTFDAAARRLRVTPSAVSQRIKALEQQLGRVLVVRTKPIAVTESGRSLLAHARQLSLLEHDTAVALGSDDGGGVPSLSIAVNADSMATWILPALARAAERTPFVVDLHREDQDRTAPLLSSGTVMAAVTSERAPVPGCTSTPLGLMRYQAVASVDFGLRWFPDGVTPEALASAPIVDFDRADDLQTRWLRSMTRQQLAPPRNYVPAASDFAEAIRHGLGWGLMLDEQIAAVPDRVVPLGGPPIDVPLFWQQWNLPSSLLDVVADEIIASGRDALVAHGSPHSE